jgi:hypothetical protein
MSYRKQDATNTCLFVSCVVGLPNGQNHKKSFFLFLSFFHLGRSFYFTRTAATTVLIMRKNDWPSMLYTNIRTCIFCQWSLSDTSSSYTNVLSPNMCYDEKYLHEQYNYQYFYSLEGRRFRYRYLSNRTCGMSMNLTSECTWKTRYPQTRAGRLLANAEDSGLCCLEDIPLKILSLLFWHAKKRFGSFCARATLPSDK